MKRNLLWIALVALVAVSGLVLVGCCTEQKCRQQFGMIQPADCPPQPPKPPPPPGPIITLTPVGLSSNSLIWRADQTELKSSGVSIYPSDPAEVCGLRNDFIGNGIHHFDLWKVGATTPDSAKYVIVESTGVRIEIRRTADNKVHWTIRQKIDDPAVCASPQPLGTFVADKLPKEFFDLTKATFKNGKTGDLLDKIELQVKM